MDDDRQRDCKRFNGEGECSRHFDVVSRRTGDLYTSLLYDAIRMEVDDAGSAWQ
ncbi:hypothetical protein ACFQI7_07940 [Paenibacillus allorhizosphaerae]|uniref:hypothetical protein n=1 Tax=Paenibacillus allorhizosphaerae TaxID=2849866 RepID=UPI001C40712D|nr:hypothetical protein [Paenibacillus allorhizosphaerae]